MKLSKVVFSSSSVTTSIRCNAFISNVKLFYLRFIKYEFEWLARALCNGLGFWMINWNSRLVYISNCCCCGGVIILYCCCIICGHFYRS